MANQKRLLRRFSMAAPTLGGRAWEEARAEIQQWIEVATSILDSGGQLTDTDEHNDLNGLQGGNASERYHFTAAQHAYLAPHQGAADPHPQYSTDDESFAEAMMVADLSGGA